MAQSFYRDRQIVRQTVPVIIGAILGGLLTGIPTVWVAIGQQKLQLELATRAEQEQRRQRKVNALKSYLTACGDVALAVDHLIIALDSGSKITIDAVRELQKHVNRYTLSGTELSAEFELIGLAPPEQLTAVMAAFERADNLSPQAIQAVVQEVRPLLVGFDRACRTATNHLLKLLFSAKRN